MPMYEDLEELRDALTNNVCTSYDDIAYYTGWGSKNKVTNVLAQIRRATIADQYGWSVPHVSHGPGVHRYVVVTTNGAPLDDADLTEVRWGAHSTLATIESWGENEAFALETIAKNDPAVRRAFKRLAGALAGAAAMAGDARDIVAAQLNGSTP